MNRNGGDSRISLCLIARDEAQMLPGCLASVRGAVDEIVVVDTGSADKTREIARAAGALVHEQPWRGDFAAARNEAARHASGDFILVLDADERLAPGAASVLRSAVASATWDAALLPLHNAAELDALPEDVVSGAKRHGTPMLLPRLLRNAGGLAWEGVVHEAVDAWLVRRGGKPAVIQAPIVHYGHVPELRAARGKRRRNLELLRRRCQLEPEDVMPFAYLAGELMEADELDEARRVAEQGWTLFDRQPRERSIHRLAAMRAILALKAGDPACALDAADRAEARQRPHPDWHYLRGCALQLLALRSPPASATRVELAERAASALRAAVAARGRIWHEQFVEGACGLPALLRRGEVLLLAGRPDEALEAFDEALREAPASREACFGRAEAMLDAGRPGDALAMLEPLLDGDPDGWLLAAAAARALGSSGDAALFLARAKERRGKGFAALHRRERMAEMSTSLAPPAAAPILSATSATLPSPLRVEGRGGGCSASRERFAVTVISPPGYAHSAAFDEVAEALVHGLRELGCDAVLGRDPALAGRRHIVLGANLVPRSGVHLREGSILYNLEQVEEGSPWLTPELLDLYRRSALWDYSRSNADALVRCGLPRPVVVPIGYVPALTRIAPAPEDIDVLFYGSMNERRAAVLRELERRGARVHAAFGVYGEERDRLVARSRIVLNVHYYEAKVFEIVRVSYLLANRRVVVSERGCDPAEEAPFEGGIAFAPYDGLVDRCLRLLARPDERQRIAEAGFRAMSARQESQYLKDAVAALGGGCAPSLTAARCASSGLDEHPGGTWRVSSAP